MVGKRDDHQRNDQKHSIDQMLADPDIENPELEFRPFDVTVATFSDLLDV